MTTPTAHRIPRIENIVWRVPADHSLSLGSFIYLGWLANMPVPPGPTGEAS